MSPDPSDLALLVERCAGGEGDEADWARLRAVADPDLRRQVARDLRLAVRLHGLLRSADPELGARVLDLAAAQRPSRRYRSLDAVQRRLRRRETRRWWPLAAAALLLLGVGLLLRGPARDRPQLLPVADAAALCDGAPVPAEGLRLDVGMAVEVRSGRVSVRWDDGSILHLDEGGRLRIAEAGPDKVIALETGRLDADIAPQAGKRSLRIDSALARTEVVGTRFAVDAQPRRTVLQVSSGIVRFSALRGGTALLVGSGRGAQVADGGEAAWLDSRPAQPHQAAIRVEVAGDAHVLESAPRKVDNRSRSMLVQLAPGASSEIYLRFPVAQWRGRVQRTWLLLETLDGPSAVEMEIWELQRDFDPDSLRWATRPQEGRRIGRMVCSGRGPQRADLGAVLAAGHGDLVLRIASLTSGVEPTVVAAREHGEHPARLELELELADDDR